MMIRTLCCLIASASLGLLVGGCGKDSDEVKYRELPGRVSGIDVATGVVKMTWYNPKKKMNQELPGKLATDAEILIDGATAKLEDIHIDDNVIVTGRVEKRNGETQLVATKVVVTRNDAPATAPAGAGTQPAENAPGTQ